VVLPGTLMFDYPTAKEISGFLYETIQSTDSYFTKATPAAKTQVVKKRKENKKKKKKRKEESESEEEEEEEEEEEVAVAVAPVYTGPSALEVLDTVKMSALDLIGAEGLAGDDALMDAGLDSLAAVEYGGILQKVFQGVVLPGTLMFDYPTAKEISGFLYETIQSTDSYFTKPTPAARSKVAKVKKEKQKKKKKKKKKSEEEDYEDEQEAPEEATKVVVYTGPTLQEVIDVVKGSADDLIGSDDLLSETPLMDAGLDSLAAVEYGGMLAKAFQGMNMPGTLMFDYPNVKSISTFIYGEMRSSQGFELDV